MRRRFAGRLHYDDIDDVVASAMLDLVDYWVHLPSSITPDDPNRNFNFAVHRGSWMASTFAVQRLMSLSHLVPLDEQVNYPGCTTPGPEPEDFEPSTEERVRQFLETVPESEYVGWLNAFLDGESVRTQATREGKHFMSVHERRTRGLRRIRSRAHGYGLSSA